MAKASKVAKKQREVLRKVVSKLNHRLDRLEKAGLDSAPAYKYVSQRYHNTRFSVKGVNTPEAIQRLYLDMANFQQMMTSTVRGAKRNLRNIARNLDLKGTPQEIQAESNQIFAAYEKLRNYLGHEDSTIYGSRRLLDTIKHKEIRRELMQAINEGGSVKSQLDKAIQKLEQVRKAELGYEGFAEDEDEPFDFIPKK